MNVKLYRQQLLATLLLLGMIGAVFALASQAQQQELPQRRSTEQQQNPQPTPASAAESAIPDAVRQADATPSSPHDASDLQDANMNSAQAAFEGERIETELILITEDGFEPRDITRSAQDKFFVAVENRSGRSDFRLRIAREGDTLKVVDVQIPPKLLAWHKVLLLPPGAYVVTEENNPAWSCRITLTP